MVGCVDAAVAGRHSSRERRGFFACRVTEHEFVTGPQIASFRFVKHPDRRGAGSEENE
jgi:hypothetical protein